ncbi:MAG: DUF4783 domain-containing protein [Cytophagaceae bacterium]|nr:DUF4783 domain-containing protein [Cytophagaceae bacterium]
MKTRIFLTAVLVLTLLFTAIGMFAAAFPNEILKATQSGNASDLAANFNDKVELILPEKSGVFSKEQAQFVMKEFFDSHRPTSFQINHEGTRDNSAYGIGTYVSSNGKYRFYFLTKNVNGKTVIIQIRIDKE